MQGFAGHAINFTVVVNLKPATAASRVSVTWGFPYDADEGSSEMLGLSEGSAGASSPKGPRGLGPVLHSHRVPSQPCPSHGKLVNCKQISCCCCRGG